MNKKNKMAEETEVQVNETEGKPKKKGREKKTKEKTEGYILKKNTGMKVARTLFWIMLIFIFTKGVLSIFKTDTQKQAEELIRNFKAEYNDFTSQNAEIMAFAQNFSREYLTYTQRGEDDYKKRLKPYVSSAFMASSGMIDFTASAAADYVQAYRIDDYSENQKDVYVIAEVCYENRMLNDDGQTYTTRESKRTLTLRVPVYVKGGSYVVEEIPLMVADESVYLSDYVIEAYYGTATNEEKTAAIKTSVENFLKAYLEQDESVINYYLSNTCDKADFTGLQGRFTFYSIEKISCYTDESGNILCIVEFQIKDAENGVKMLQKINLSMSENGGKFYINDMNVRTGNLVNK